MGAATIWPSPKLSFQRFFRASWSWSIKARPVAKTASAAPSERRRWTADCEPYRAGNSLHGPPDYTIQRMPSQHCRSVRRGRSPWLLGGRWSYCASMHSRGEAVTARQVMGHRRDLVGARHNTTCQAAEPGQHRRWDEGTAPRQRLRAGPGGADPDGRVSTGLVSPARVRGSTQPDDTLRIAQQAADCRALMQLLAIQRAYVV